jgi:hypothetical protein
MTGQVQQKQKQKQKKSNETQQHMRRSYKSARGIYVEGEEGRRAEEGELESASG